MIDAMQNSMKEKEPPKGKNQVLNSRSPCPVHDYQDIEPETFDNYLNHMMQRKSDSLTRCIRSEKRRVPLIAMCVEGSHGRR